jgi:uncharacterized protein YraI
MKKFFLLLFLLISVMASAQSVYKVTGSKVNVRNAPSTNKSKIVGSLSKGQTVTVLSIKNDWAVVDYKGKNAYVSIDYLEPDKPSSSKNHSQQTKASSDNHTPKVAKPVENRNQQAKNTYNKQKQIQKNSSNLAPFVEEQTIIVCAEGGKPCFELLGGLTTSLNEYLSVGGGIGIGSNFNAPPYIPLFARLSIEKKSSNITPFFMLDAGYDFSLEDIKMSTIRLNPTLGIKTGGFYVGAGYLASIPTQKEADVVHCVNIKLGIEFDADSKSSAFRRALTQLGLFIKNKTYIEAEFGGGIGMKTEEFAPDENIRIGNNVHLNIAWNYKAHDKWDIGIGSGYRHYMISSPDEDIEYKLHSIPLYLRNKFYVFPDVGDFKPYAGLDIGINMMTEETIVKDEAEIRQNGRIVGYEDVVEELSSTKLIFRPQVGVLYKEKYSATLSYTHTSLEGDNGNDSSVPSLDLTLGIRLW